MSAIVIKADNQNTKILKELAKKLGANVLNINEEQYEVLALGFLMEKSKTGKTVSREFIMKKYFLIEHYRTSKMKNSLSPVTTEPALKARNIINRG